MPSTFLPRTWSATQSASSCRSSCSSGTSSATVTHAFGERGDGGPERIQRRGLAPSRPGHRPGCSRQACTAASGNSPPPRAAPQARQSCAGEVDAQWRICAPSPTSSAWPPGMTAFSREPSRSRTSTIGAASSSRRPAVLTMRLIRLRELLVRVEIDTSDTALCDHREWRRCAVDR